MNLAMNYVAALFAFLGAFLEIALVHCVFVLLMIFLIKGGIQYREKNALFLGV